VTRLAGIAIVSALFALAAAPGSAQTATPAASTSATPAASPAASATPDAQLAARLADTQKRLDEISKSLAQASEKEKALLAAIDDLDHEIADKSDDIRQMSDDVAHKRQQADDDKAQMEAIRTRISKKKHWLAGRVRSAFIHGRPGYLKVLFSAESYPELVRKTRFQAIVARRDAQMVEELKKDLDDVARHRADYDQDLALLESMESDARAKSEELALEKKFREELLAKVESEKSGFEKMREALAAAAEQLAQKVGALQGGSTEAVAPHAKRAFADSRGKLAAPVKASVKLGYGPYKHPKLGLQMIHQGVSFASPIGTEVRAVADGRVEMARWFSSYGQVLVIDHGDGWRTLYAHNARLDKKEGDDVREGDVVALSGDTGSLEGPELYFAIFREGKPVDPGEWVTGMKPATPLPAPAPTPGATPSPSP